MKKLVIVSVIFCLLVGFAVASDFGTYKKTNYPWYNPTFDPIQTTTAPPTSVGVVPTATPTPVVTPIPPKEPKNPVSLYQYDVMVLDGIDVNQIQMALRFVPNLFDFTIIQDNSTEYSFSDCYSMDGIYPVPQRSRLITVFNGTLHGYVHPGATGYYFGSGRATAVYLGQDPYLFSFIITHECLHEALNGSGVDQDKLQGYKDTWNAWMATRTVGHWSGDESEYVGSGWNRLKEDYLIWEAMT